MDWVNSGCVGARGIYHVATHPPDAQDFARILKRLIDRNYSVSPTDHTFSKAIYLDGPDGINVEITLETRSVSRNALLVPATG